MGIVKHGLKGSKAKALMFVFSPSRQLEYRCSLRRVPGACLEGSANRFDADKVLASICRLQYSGCPERKAGITIDQSATLATATGHPGGHRCAAWVCLTQSQSTCRTWWAPGPFITVADLPLLGSSNLLSGDKAEEPEPIGVSMGGSSPQLSKESPHAPIEARRWLDRSAMALTTTGSLGAVASGRSATARSPLSALH